ncbi:MAG TPA: VIT domain-containing protein [Pyrinomonadaceae bacterium]|nr:VIT domain-containing protein [Pyrinomonadaceae bacterium]
MRRKSFLRPAKSFLKPALFTVFVFACLLTPAYFSRAEAQLAAPQQEATPGSLQVTDAGGKALGACPLKHTDVHAEISGFLSRVRVTQEFENPFKEKIEAVYTFPLPQNAAVDDMTMTIGERTVRGRILPREEARIVYEDAKSSGRVASLLDQERPNIFTQAVANIMPGEKVTVTISYIETLKYEEGSYQFVFPMTVAPRYIPGRQAEAAGAGSAPSTNAAQVPDASKITPPLAPAGVRAGHDISLEVALDAGVPVDDLKSNSHEIDVERLSGWSARVRLRNRAEIPNRDFVLKYDVAGGRIEDALLAHRTDKGGFFTLILQPPDRAAPEDVTPKEIIFVLDTSGSMQGFPIEKAKEAMKLALDGLNPQDTFNLITFAGDTHILFPQPVAATRENLQKAQSFLASRSGDGGTEMMKAIKLALDPSDNQGHIRVVCFMTDGEVGNDLEIIGEVQKHKEARVFAFGIGSSVNRFLLDKIAEEGRGEVEYVSLNDDGSLAARKFHERVRSPLLTDISIDWAGLPVADLYPKRIPDLFSAKPVILTGRYTKGGRALVRLKGKIGGRDFVRELSVELPDMEARHDVLQTLWARTRVDDLMREDYLGVQQGKAHADLKETITQLGLEYGLMTQFTSFVAVEEMIVTDGGAPRRIDVPVELPEGMSSSDRVFTESDQRSGFISSYRRRSDPGNITPSTAPSPVNLSAFELPAQAGKIPPPSQGNASAGRVGMNKGKGSNTKGVSQSGASVAATQIYNAPVSAGVLNGNAANLSQTAFFGKREERAAEKVIVQVTIDERGNVIAAKAVVGNPQLYATTVEAARKAVFAPTMLSGRAVKVTGAIVYNFVPGATTPTSSSVVLGEEEVARLLETEKRRELQMKLHSTLLALVDRLKERSALPGALEAGFVRDGRAELQVWLKDKSDETMAKLKELGFEVLLEPKTTGLVIGRIPVEKLSALAELDFVRYVAPQKSR